jgi:hypothetical protein
MRRTGSNILAPGLRSECFSDSPFSRLHRSKELQATRLPLQRLACGKSYPVTAAQLPRLRTGFLAPIHCFKVAKNCPSNSGLRFRIQDLFSQARFPRAFFL